MQRQTNEPNDLELPNDLSELEENVAATAKAVADEAEKIEKASKSSTVSAEEYEKLRQELDEAKDRALRALAELENFRARSNRLAQEERKYASLDLARAILPIWDNMGRALDAAGQSSEIAPLIDGLQMMRQEFLDVFAKQGIKRIDALHKPFDPTCEESIAFAPNAEFPANTVVFETQAGFKLHDRVVRPAQVVLASTPDESAASEASPNAERAE